MTSVERVLEYSCVEPEAQLESSPGKKPPATWPEHGAITFDGVSLSYTKGEPPVLKELHCHIKAREKIGVVGRTGAGKSSIIAALFRMTEPDGAILIDGVDIRFIGLHDLRSKISIIPQDPVLFTGPVRRNLDPFSEHSDTELWKALEESKPGALEIDDTFAVKGSYSVVDVLKGGLPGVDMLDRSDRSTARSGVFLGVRTEDRTMNFTPDDDFRRIMFNTSDTFTDDEILTDLQERNPSMPGVGGCRMGRTNHVPNPCDDVPKQAHNEEPHPQQPSILRNSRSPSKERSVLSHGQPQQQEQTSRSRSRTRRRFRSRSRTRHRSQPHSTSRLNSSLSPLPCSPNSSEESSQASSRLGPKKVAWAQGPGSRSKRR
ncbi:hypothetical protein HPB52_022258 [Rhipicephalus sanguineus]|uniref:ABC transporter domain-containing protein n=1 Tax=Rhipicephalus sanguineus TaxID=34632 RepID=A0A9D4Q3E1_RHISA|nr:hypothetical protein HPB52_022258 [Rhipicephalus sanguineus]